MLSFDIRCVANDNTLRKVGAVMLEKICPIMGGIRCKREACAWWRGMPELGAGDGMCSMEAIALHCERLCDIETIACAVSELNDE